ncbi:MAG TPA: hypothetical protein VII52_14570 [Gemmatimonadaceae bacterium]
MLKMAMMTVAMFTVVTTVAQAQRGGGRGPNVMAILKDSLHVSDVVLAKADSIQKLYQANNAPLMEAMRNGDADARAKMMENRAKQNEAIKALLNDTQKAEFDRMMPARRGGPPPR